MQCNLETNQESRLCGLQVGPISVQRDALLETYDTTIVARVSRVPLLFVKPWHERGPRKLVWKSREDYVVQRMDVSILLLSALTLSPCVCCALQKRDAHQCCRGPQAKNDPHPEVRLRSDPLHAPRPGAAML